MVQFQEGNKSLRCPLILFCQVEWVHSTPSCGRSGNDNLDFQRSATAHLFIPCHNRLDVSL